MAERTQSNDCCESVGEGTNCYQIDAIVNVDRRGQIILPKTVREKAGVGIGDKFAVISCEHDGKICCIILVKADEFTETVKDVLEPMLKGITE